MAMLSGPEDGPVPADAGQPGPASDLLLMAGGNSVPLAVLLPFAVMPTDGTCPPAEGDEDFASGDLRVTLGRMIAALIARQGADRRALYRLSLVLALLTRNREAHAILQLLDVRSMDHPAFFALRGYLALQMGEVDPGRRFLASAALASRGSPANRSILHFTQHVLLVHQFNG
ncbi:MAG: hypothetical protein R3D90_01060 [Paracoccaceae bacterium]